MRSVCSLLELRVGEPGGVDTGPLREGELREGDVGVVVGDSLRGDEGMSYSFSEFIFQLERPQESVENRETKKPTKESKVKRKDEEENGTRMLNVEC